MDYAVIVAGGRGTRMGGATPKQFLLLKNKPVLMHTLERFRQALPQVELIVVLPEDCWDTWRALTEQYHFRIPHRLVKGGETRFHSVRNGLELVRDLSGVVGVHDGVRPFVSVDVIRHCYQQAGQGLSVVPALQSVESVRLLNEERTQSEAFDRNRCYFVQTPQTFPSQLLKKAYSQPYHSLFTDDASVVEAMGEKITIVEGNRENIKLTSPFDLTIAQTLLSEQGND